MFRPFVSSAYNCSTEDYLSNKLDYQPLGSTCGHLQVTTQHSCIGFSRRVRRGRGPALGSRARQFITAHAPGRLLCTSPREGYAFVPSRYQQTMLRGRRCSRALFACRSLSTMSVATYIAILRSSDFEFIIDFDTFSHARMHTAAVFKLAA